MKYILSKKHILLLLLLISGLYIISFDIHSEIYKWTDENGQVHFGDARPQEIESEQITVKVNTYTSPSIEEYSKIFDSDSKQPSGLKNNKVVMYSASWCGVCKKARKYFKQNHIPFKEYDIETSEKGKRAFKKLNGKGVPIILVKNKRMNGFSEKHFRSLYN